MHGPANESRVIVSFADESVPQSNPYLPLMSSTLKILAAEHPIKSVTVFKSSKAEIVRTFALDLTVRFTSFLLLCMLKLSLRLDKIGYA
jgi:hypothetical protein